MQKQTRIYYGVKTTVCAKLWLKMTGSFEGPILAVDVGGTKTLLACFDPKTNRIVKEVRFATNKSYSGFLQDFKQHLPELNVERFSAAGIGVPGRLDRATGTGISFGNLGWTNTPVKTDFETLLGCPVSVENDAKVGALSEAKLIKDDFKTVMYITIGTGIGIAIINNGIIDTNYGDRGGKAVMIDFNGQKVEWESVISGRAITQHFGKNASAITDEATWQIVAHDLALGLKQLVEEKHPQAIVIGGGAGEHFERYGNLLKQELSNMAQSPLPAILPAKHAEQAVIYGCVELVKYHASVA